MERSSVIQVLTVLWVFIAAVTLPYALFIAHDAWLDVRARSIGRLNHGRETLARLLVVTSSLCSVAFLIFLLVGLYALSPYSRVDGPWRGLVVPSALVLAEAVLGAMLIYKQRVRKRVLTEDINSEAVRVAAAALLAAESLAANTEALQRNSDVVEENTVALQTDDESKVLPHQDAE